MKRFAFALWLSAISLNAYANSANCHQKANTPESIAATMDQALQLKQQLNSQPDPVVILVRQGQDMSSRHLTWSHAGYAMRQPNGDWRVYHNLNTCGTAESALYIQGLYEFLADDLVNQSIAVLRPRSDIATALQTLLHSAIKLNLFHSPRYNLIAWPFSGLIRIRMAGFSKCLREQTMRRFGHVMMPAAGCSFRVINPLSLVLALLND